MITVKNLCVKIKEQQLLNSIVCTLVPGRITTFIGKSGAGKTTLLKTLAGLIKISSGTILCNGQQLNELTSLQRAQEIGYVFQDFNLFRNLTVLENCVNPLVVQGMDKSAAQKIASATLQELGLQDFSNAYPSQLSGGQQQRVAIARALCLQPKVLLLDEPTASLDPINTEILVLMVRKLISKGLTVGVSTQDMQFAQKIFDRVYYIENGEIVEFCDTKENAPSCQNIKQFIYGT